jgi:translation elongation factor EF-4
VNVKALRKNVTASVTAATSPQEEAPREAEGREEAHEADRGVEIPQAAFLAVLSSDD